jgi:hypothetical protein
MPDSGLLRDKVISFHPIKSPTQCSS